MPSSMPSLILPVINVALAVKPKTVLDIGVGFGKVGFLLREYLSLWQNEGAIYPKDMDWSFQLDGIEIFPDYIGPLQEMIYDKIHVGDARKVLPTLGTYDLIIMSEVIEHLPKEDGQAIIRRCIDGQAGVLLVTTPADGRGQKAVFGNDAERHLCQWTQMDLKELGCFEFEEITATRRLKDDSVEEVVNFLALFGKESNAGSG